MLFVKHYHTLPPPYGGVQVFVKRLMLALCKRGLISGAFKGKEIVGIPQEYVQYLDVFPNHSRSFFILPEIVSLYRIFKSYQIIHAHTSLTTIFGIWLVHKLQNKPLVYTIHNQMIDSEFSRLYFWDKWCFKSLAQASNVQFITVNENAKQALLKRNVFFKNDVEVMPAYIPPVEIGTPSDYLDSDLVSFINLHPVFMLFYAESFAVYNGMDVYGTQIVIDAFIKAKKKHKELALVFCLANVENSSCKLEQLKDQICRAGYSDSVYWQVGAMHEMWPLLKTSTVLIRPTITDGDSIMVREALSYGLPVIASDVTKRPEGCWIYPVNETSRLVSLICEIVNSPYKTIFPQVDYTERMMDIYNKIISKQD